MVVGYYILGSLTLLSSFQTILSQTATACAGAPNGAFVRNSISCQAYYYCSDGEAHPNQCPDNYVFEPIRQMCQIPSYVQCTGCSPFGVQHIAHPTDCSSYYLCVSGIRTLQKCKDNLLFDKSIGDCNAAGSVMCITDYTQICSEFGGYVKIGDPNDCSKYFSCLYGVAYHQDCAPGLFFKPATASCTFPEDDDFCEGSQSGDDPSMALTHDNISVEPPMVLPIDNYSEEALTSDNISEEVLPSDDISEEVLPSDDISEEVLPSDNFIEEFLHSENLSVEFLPSDNLSEEILPSDNYSDEDLPRNDFNDEPLVALPDDSNSDETLPNGNYSDELQTSDNISDENLHSKFSDESLIVLLSDYTSNELH